MSSIMSPGKLRLSRWAHFFQFDGGGIFYHSLLKNAVFLFQQEYVLVEKFLLDQREFSSIQNIIKELTQTKILIPENQNEDEILLRLKKDIPAPYVGIMQLIVAKTCNLACRYCFEGNGQDIGQRSKEKEQDQLMSGETAKQALVFFSRQMQEISAYFPQEKEIIFYGGEPLLNMPAVETTVAEARKMQKEGLLPQKMSFSMVTNGTLLTKKTARKLKDLNINVSISLDGADAESNVNRIDRAGRKAFSKIVSGIRNAQSEGLHFGLSVTLTEETMKRQEEFIDFIIGNGITGINFNIIIGINDPVYFKKASSFIIDFYRKTKQYGIMEDRILRKINALSSSCFYYHDCAALSGNQIVVMPNGDVGLCQGTINTDEFIIGKISDEHLSFSKCSMVHEWIQNTPVNKKECIECPAIAICGGGCPINARLNSANRSLLSLDSRFCVHTKDTLMFLLQEMALMIQEDTKTKESDIHA